MRKLRAFWLRDRILVFPILFLRRVLYSILYRIENRFRDKIHLYNLVDQMHTTGFVSTTSVSAGKARLIVRLDKLKQRPVKEISLRSRGSDFFVFSQIFVNHEYKPLIDIIYEKGMEASINSIVDAGANIGLSTIFFKDHFPHARVIAIEPDEGNFDVLTENINSCHLMDVTPLKAGLWCKETKLSLDRGFRDSLDWSLTLRDDLPEFDSPLIEGYTLAQIRTKYQFDPVDILKIDIEGGERFLFSDAETARATLMNVRFLALEIHDEFQIREKIETALNDNNFEFFSKGETCFAFSRNIYK